MAWLACQFFSEYTAPLTHHLFLNPVAWQFLFAIGVTLGIERRIEAAPVAESSATSLGQSEWRGQLFSAPSFTEL